MGVCRLPCLKLEGEEPGRLGFLADSHHFIAFSPALAQLCVFVGNVWHMMRDSEDNIWARPAALGLAGLRELRPG